MPDTAELAEAFARDGVVCVRAALDPAEVATAARGIEAALASPGPLTLVASGADDPGRFTEDFCRWQEVAEIEHLARRSRIPRIAATLMRTPRVRLYHDHVLVKEGGTSQRTPWHQDQPYYNVDGRGVSAWIPVDPVPLEGCLELVAGSHGGTWLMPRTFLTGEARWFPEGSLAELPDVDADRDAYDIRRFELAPGDAIFFDFLTVHGAPGFPFSGARRVLSLRYLSAGATFAPRRWRTSPPFDGLDHELAAGADLDHPLFPIVWPADGVRPGPRLAARPPGRRPAMGAPGSVVLGRRYALEEKIGAGGYSQVWRGTDTVLTRQVAVKLLHLGYAQEAEVLARFRAEAQHAGALSHENIARVYDYREPDPPQPPFLVMEFVDGPSLAAVLANGPLDPSRTMDIVAQTAAGLHAAHLAGLVHRDIKPANLLLGPRRIVKITDFGIAHAVGRAPMTDTNQLVGTPGYLAPERAMGAQATAASDLYSLGIVAYECLAGAPPFTGVALAVALAHHERPLPPLASHVPAEVAALVLELTAKDPAARTHSAGEVAARAGALAARLRTGVSEPAGVRSGDPAAAVAGQTMRYPVAPPESVTELPTQHLAAQGPMHRTARSQAGAFWRRRTGRAALSAAAGLLVVVAALLIGSVTGPGHASHAGTVPSATPSGPARAGPARARTVDVRRATLVGQSARTAARLLRQQGLVVRIRWRHSDAQAPGTVLSVRPAGPRPVGSLVTLTAALRPEQPGPGQPGRGQPGRGHPGRGPHGHGPHGHGGQGDGQQGGDGQRAGHGHQGNGTGHHHGDPGENVSLA